MPLLPFLIGIGIVVVAVQKIAENAPIAGAAFGVLIFLITIFLANLSSKKKALQEATRRAIISEFKWTDNIDPLEFERRCQEAMQLSGWIAQTTKSTGDQGADVIANKRGTKVVLQCKLYSNTVGNKAVQEVFAAKTHLSANFAAVVSNCSYTRSAKELAVTTGVLLLDYSQLREANLLFGFPGDGVPPLQYQSGVTPSDVTRARRYVMFCVIAFLPVLLIGLGVDAAHNISRVHGPRPRQLMRPVRPMGRWQALGILLPTLSNPPERAMSFRPFPHQRPWVASIRLRQ